MASNLQVRVASGEALDVRAFNIEQEINTNFEVSLLVHAENPEVSFDDVLGQDASFTLAGKPGPHVWAGVCNHIEQEQAEVGGLSTYRLTIVPKLWMLTQRTNRRIFQQVSEIDIVKKLLGEWGITPRLRLTTEYKERKYTVQYDESDFDFVSRLLEDAGVSYYFEQERDQTTLVLDDAPHDGLPQDSPIPWNPRSGNNVSSIDHFSAVEFKQRVRPGKFTIQDHDYRKPAAYKLMASADGGLASEKNLELFVHDPGSFLVRGEAGDTPAADDKGAARTDEKLGARQARRRLAAHRAEGKRVHFRSNAYQLVPGVVYTMTDHPRSDLGKPLLVVSAHLSGGFQGDWQLHGQSVTTDEAFHPPLRTLKPRAQGTECATVVGPPGEEIHCDEFGRVRVQFHWDREGSFDDNSSCWIHVNQPWSGAGYGGTSLPRVGQEVIVDFLAGDPERPVIIGRVYTATQTTPYKLPDNKTQSGWKSNSTGGTGGYNEIKFEDTNGAEVFSTQAQRDLSELVKRNSDHTVGNDKTLAVGRHRRASISGNDREAVGGDQQNSVIGQMKSLVGADKIGSVLGNLLSSAGGQRVLKTVGDFVSSALSHNVASEKGTTLTVGQSMIHMTPDAIIIQTPKLLLNPGEKVAQAAVLTGRTPAPKA